MYPYLNQTSRPTGNARLRDRQLWTRAIIGLVGASLCTAACLLGATAYATVHHVGRTADAASAG